MQSTTLFAYEVSISKRQNSFEEPQQATKKAKSSNSDVKEGKLDYSDSLEADLQFSREQWGDSQEIDAQPSGSGASETINEILKQISASLNEQDEWEMYNAEDYESESDSSDEEWGS